MVAQRFPTSEDAKPTVLGEELRFKTCGRVASNRFFKAAMSELQATYSEDPKETGVPTDRLVNLYAKWARGGFGAVCTGNVIVDHRHIEAAGNVVISEETDSAEKREQLRKWATAMRSGGALAIVQLNHCGRQTPINVNPTPFSASDVQLNKRMKTTFGKPVPLTVEQIRTEVVDRFVFAARQCFEAGFDGIELHAAHGYLLTQFLSPTTNLRTDEYGGSAENRARIVEEIYLAIRAEISAESGFVVGVKLNSADCPQSGSLEDVIQIATKFDRLGFDFIEITGGSYEKWTLFHYKESTKQREAFFIEFASALKPAIHDAVLYLTGGFRTVGAMVQAVEGGDTDGVGLAKPSAAEPDIADKILHQGVQSVAFNHFETDYGMSGLLAQSQMSQAGRTTVEEAGGDPCFGITDHSDEREAKKFEDGALQFLTSVMKSEALDGRPHVGVFEYQPDRNYSFCGSSIVRCVFSLYSRCIGIKK